MNSFLFLRHRLIIIIVIVSLLASPLSPQLIHLEVLLGLLKVYSSDFCNLPSVINTLQEKKKVFNLGL